MKFTSFRRLLAAGVALAILSGAAPAFAAPPRSDEVAEPDLTVRAPNGLPINKCVPESLRKHTISFRASDGVRVSGLAFGSGEKGVVLEHEQGWYICSWLPFAQILASRGYNVVLLEARGTGASAKVTEGQLKHLDRDFLAAAHELTRRGATTIVAGGASQGGTAAINSAPKIPSLAGLIVFSSPRDSDPYTPEMDALESIKKVTKPSFFAVSPGDMGNAFVVEVKGLYEASGATEKHYETVGGGIHGVGMMDSPEGGAALREKLLAFIADAFAKVGLTDSPDSPTTGAPAGTGAEAAAGTGTGTKVTAGTKVTTGGQASTSDERPWTPIALTVGVAAMLLIGAVGLLRRRRS
jgi:pimeloyl-ACP methyl ester carboxylesterase